MGDRLGTSVSDAGDFNGDGIGDYILGAPNHYQTGTTNKNGIAYLIFGSKNSSSYTSIDLLSDITTAGIGFKVCNIECS